MKDRFWIYKRTFDMDIGPYEFFVYGFLVSIADGGTVRISLTNLAERLKISRRRVIYALQKLQQQRMIQIQTRTGKPNTYALTSQDEWCIKCIRVVHEMHHHSDEITDKGHEVVHQMHHHTDDGVGKSPFMNTSSYDKITNGGKTIEAQGLEEVVHEMHHSTDDDQKVVHKMHHPPKGEGGETLEHQGLEEVVHEMHHYNSGSTSTNTVRTYNIYDDDENKYIYNHHNIHHNISGSISTNTIRTCREEKSSCMNTSSYCGKGKNPSKGKKPSAFVNSAAARERNNGLSSYVEMARKWNLQTLSPEQAAFFLLNSRLSPEITEKEILKADRSDVIRNPIGYLISVLMVNTKKAKHKELLLVERQDPDPAPDEKQSPEVEKFLNEVAEKLSVDVSQEPFKAKRKKLAKAIFKKILSKEDRESILRNIENVPQNMKEEVAVALIWAKYLREEKEGIKKRMLERALV